MGKYSNAAASVYDLEKALVDLEALAEATTGDTGASGAKGDTGVQGDTGIQGDTGA